MKEYSLVIAANFMDHYMLALSLELKKYFKDFYFIASEELEEKYRKLGFPDLNNRDFVIKAYEDKRKAREIILNADVVLTGSYKYMSHIYERLFKKKQVIYFSERLFKNDNKLANALRYVKYFVRHGFDKKSLLLCVSAYTASDYNQIGVFNGRTYKWGYFPEVKKYEDIDSLINEKNKNSIFWAGRLIEWKHPDYAVEVCKRLKDEDYSFHLKIAGNGPMEEELKKMIKNYNLEDCVELLGPMPPEKIREYMEKSQIYLFTSDKGEGWGVVLNEALNSACATVASYSAGSTPFLVEDGANGLVYNNNSVDEMFSKVKSLLDDKEKLVNIEKKSYDSICNEWNSSKAAERLFQAIDRYISGSDFSNLFSKGIMSRSYPNGK